MSRSLGVVAAVLVSVALAGCAGGATEEELESLREAGLALMPPGSTVVGTSEGACVKLRGNPTCVRIYFVADLSEDGRVDALVEAGRPAGWEVVSREPVRDGTWLQLEREGFRAFAAVWNDERSERCRAAPDTACADELNVIEDF